MYVYMYMCLYKLKMYKPDSWLHFSVLYTPIINWACQTMILRYTLAAPHSVHRHSADHLTSFSIVDDEVLIEISAI